MSIKESQILAMLQQKVAELERVVKTLQEQPPQSAKRGPGRPKNNNK